LGVSICFKKISSEKNGLLFWIKKALLNVCNRIEAYEKSKKNYTKEELLFVSIKNGCVYINDVKIINEEAEKQFLVFKFLLKNHVLKLLDSQKGGLKVYQIASMLEEGSCDIVSEKQVRQIIYRIRESITQKCRSFISDEVIQFHPSVGYYLGKKVVLITA
jgi:hypothetical protein